ncbi:MAG: protein kinase [Polyangiales bacterium]
MESPPPPSDRVGETVGGRYVLRRLIGVGGYSAVYEATHAVTGRVVALKLLHPHLLLHREIIDRFLLEARSMSNVRHDGIVQVLDAGVDESSSVYIALELLEGESMEALLQRQQTLAWPAAALYCAHVLDALSEAHRHNVIHRDIKPGNIFLARAPDGGTHARLLDFGIALVAHQKRITGAGMLLGTPEYMSPEQCLAAPVGPETDLWAVGIVLWECLTGHTPFLAESATATLLRITTASAPSIRDELPELPTPLASVIDRALERDVEKRWRSADDMRDALLRVLRRNGGPEGVAAARMASRSSSRLQAVQAPPGRRMTPEPEVVDLSAVLNGQRGGGPGVPLTAVVSGGAGARLSAPPPEAPPPPRSVSPPAVDPSPAALAARMLETPVAALLADDVIERPQQRSSPPTRPPATRSARPGDASRSARPGDAPLRKTAQEFELPPEAPTSAAPATPPPAAPPPEPFALPELSPEERAARSFTGERATFQPPPPTAAAPRSRAARYVAVAAGALAAVGGVVAVLTRAPDAPPQPPPTEDAALALAAPDVAQAPAEFSLTEAFAMAPPSPTADDAAEFARHASAGASSSGGQRVLASCVPAAGGATLAVRATTAGAQRRLAAGVVACAGHDLGVVSDVTADGVEDVVAVGAAPDTLVLVDSATLRAERSTTVPGVRGVAVGAQVRVRGASAAVVFVEPAGPGQPTEVRAVGAQSLTELWRRAGDGPNARLGHPDELGLAVGPDVDGDGVDDVAAGMGPVVGAPGDSRCVQVLSGADGHPLWAAPFCRALPGASQSVSLGADVNGDGRADVAVGTAHAPEGEAAVVILSGADGAVLRRIAAPPGAQGFGASVSLGGDVDGDRRPDLAVSAMASVHLFDATTGERRGGLALAGTAGAPVRVQVVPPLPGESSAGLVVASAPEGVRVFAHAGAAP